MVITALSTILWVEELIFILISIRQIRSPQLIWLRYGPSVFHMSRQECSDCWMISLLQGDVGFQAHFHKVLDNTDFLCLRSTVALKRCSQGPLLLSHILLFKFCLPLSVCLWLEVVTNGRLANMIQNHIARSAEEFSSIFMKLTSKFSDSIQRGHIQSSLRTVPSRWCCYYKPFHFDWVRFFGLISSFFFPWY